MATHTFPCPFCGRRMGVGAEYLGKLVRCPHCKQTVQAPATPDAAPAATAAPAPLPAPPPEPPSPMFKVQKREGADSIMGDPEESDDEVFSSQGGHKLRIPDLPPEPPAAPPLPASADDPFAFGGAPPPPPAEPPRRAAFGSARPAAPKPPPPPPAAASDNPFADFGEPVAPPPPPPRPAPPRVAPPPPPPTPVAAAPADADPFGDFGADEPAPVASPVRGAVKTVEATLEAEEEPAPRRGRQAVAEDPAKPWKMAVYGLAAYALLMTILAIYGLTRTPTADHPSQPTPTEKKRK